MSAPGVPFHESVRSCTPIRMAGFSGEPIALRVEGHVENGRSVAEFLRKDRRVEWVNLRGFSESPYHALAQNISAGAAAL